MYKKIINNFTGDSILFWNILSYQKKLDNLIHSKKGLLFRETIRDREIALYVEFGELMNEVQKFKYWKDNKKFNKERILDELVDCLHFSASLYNEDKISVDAQIILDFYNDELYELEFFRELNSSYKYTHFEWLFAYGLKLGFTEKEIYNGYIKKNKENIERVNGGY